MAKFIIIIANCTHPSGESKFSLLEDQNGNTVEFDTFSAANQWCDYADSDAPLAYTVLCTDDFKIADSVRR